MPEKNLRNIPGTRIYLAGSRNFKLTNPKNVSKLKKMGIEKVFLIYKNTPEGIKTAHGMSEEQERFFEVIAHSGIRVGTLLRDSHSFRDYDSFHRDASSIPGKIVIECVNGKHSSAAYAAYHIANSTRLSYKGIAKRLELAGLEKRDMITVRVYLKHAGIDLKKLIEKRDQRIHLQKKFKGALKAIGKKKIKRRGKR